MNKKYIIGLVVIVIVLAGVIMLRLLSPEDDWRCEDGIWIRHGNPSASMPKEQCNKVK